MYAKRADQQKYLPNSTMWIMKISPWRQKGWVTNQAQIPSLTPLLSNSFDLQDTSLNDWAGLHERVNEIKDNVYVYMKDRVSHVAYWCIFLHYSEAVWLRETTHIILCYMYMHIFAYNKAKYRVTLIAV